MAIAVDAGSVGSRAVPSSGDALHAHGVSQSECWWAAATHATLLVTTILPVPVVAPLAIWLIKRGESAFLDDHGKEAVNFQISLLIYGAGIAIVTLGVGVLAWPLIALLGIVGMVMAIVSASSGNYFRYPMCLRIIR